MVRVHLWVLELDLGLNYTQLLRQYLTVVNPLSFRALIYKVRLIRKSTHSSG